MIKHFFALDHHVIYVCLHISSQLSFKYPSYNPLIGRSDILQTKRLYLVMIVTRQSDEGGLLLIK